MALPENKAAGLNTIKSAVAMLPDYYMQVFTSLEQLGLDETATIQETWAAMPNMSQLEIGVGQYENLNWNCPVGLGEISIVRLGEPRGHIWRIVSYQQVPITVCT